MEDKYFRDAEQTFKLTVRRDRLFAKWVADLTARDDVAAYTDEITDARFKGGGDAGVVSKALADLHAAGHNLTEQAVAAKLRELMVEVVEQFGDSGSS